MVFSRFYTNVKPCTLKQSPSEKGGPTSFSKTQALNFLSGRRQCHSCWLLSSRHSQCFRNSTKHDLLISLILNATTIISIPPSSIKADIDPGKCNSHARRTPRHFSALPHAIHFALAIGVRLAHHEIIVVGFTSRTDEVCCAEEGRGAGADFGYFGHRVGEGCGVDEDGLVEPDLMVN